MSGSFWKFCALGCTLYHCLAGQVPFPAESIPEKLDRHRNELPAALRDVIPGIPQRICEIVERMMAKSPADRPQAPADVATILRQKTTEIGQSHVVAPDEPRAATKTILPADDDEVRVSSRYGPQDTLASRYQVSSLIGKGGMGEVYRAYDIHLSRTVAIKTLLEFKRLDSTALKRFEREAKSLAALSHPNVLAVFDIGEHDGVPFVVMEMVEGETLNDLYDATASILAGDSADRPRNCRRFGSGSWAWHDSSRC